MNNKRVVLSALFFLISITPVHAAIVSQNCVDNYVNYGGVDEYDGYSCNTSTSYAMEGEITLRDITNGVGGSVVSIFASMTQDIFYTESFSMGSSSGETITNLTIAPIGLGTYTMNRVDWLLDGGTTIGSSANGNFTETLSGNGYTLDGTTEWFIGADGLLANVYTLDGDGDGIAGMNLYFNGVLNEIADVSLTTSAVPVPAAVWLFGSGLIGLASFARRKKA